MPKTQPLIVKSHGLYDLIVHPHFADILPDFTGYYNGALSEFTVYDNVSLAKGTPIIDMFRNQNFLKRKDASCKTDWSTVGYSTNRRITVQELYGAVENCQQEFYQGCLKDFRQYNPKFRDFILSSFKQGMGLDLAVNSYFGNIERAEDPNAIPGARWSWNKFDGIFTKIAQYIAANVIKAGQAFAIAGGAITPANAYAALKNLVDNQTDLMESLPDLDKVIICDYKLAKAYERYLISIGINHGQESVGFVQNGIPTLKFEGIPIMVEKLWNPVLKAMNGGVEAHAAVLTISGNWIFGTNKNYGGGPDEDQGLRVWWSDDDEVWRQKMYLVGGTDIIMPEHTVIGITAIA